MAPTTGSELHAATMSRMTLSDRLITLTEKAGYSSLASNSCAWR
jgi:hypothetical protein